MDSNIKFFSPKSATPLSFHNKVIRVPGAGTTVCIALCQRSSIAQMSVRFEHKSTARMLERQTTDYW